MTALPRSVDSLLRRLRRTAAPDPLDRDVRKAFVQDARPLTPYVAAEADGLLFFVSTHDRLGRSLFARRSRHDMGFLARAVELLREHGVDPAGSTFVDVGANIGTTTVTALRRHGFARGVAIEPEPANVLALRLNLVANGLDTDVTVLQAAASDRPGELRLAVSQSSSGEHELAADGAISVRAVALDELAREGTIEPERVGLLWIDAAGAEAAVLAGASELLARGTPVVAAVRKEHALWPGARADLLRLLGSYTHFASVRTQSPVSGDLAAVLDSVERNGDVLAFRPPATPGAAPRDRG